MCALTFLGASLKQSDEASSVELNFTNIRICQGI